MRIINKWIRRRIRQKKGSLLVETLLAVMILSVSITLIIQSMASSLKASKYVEGYTQVALMLQNKMTEILQNPFVRSDVNQEGICSDADKIIQFRIKTAKIDEDYQRNINNIEIEAIWEEGKRKNRIFVATLLLSDGNSNE